MRATRVARPASGWHTVDGRNRAPSPPDDGAGGQRAPAEKEKPERMRRPNWLDAIVERFQHNWETNPQYRAMISGVIGLVIIVGLCATMGVAVTFANSIGGAFGGGNGNAFIASSGPNAQSTDVAFPMTTLTPWPAPNIPGAAPIPASQTPQPTPTPPPTPTPLPTATPCLSNCGGGGGGGGGGYDKITVSVTPSTFKDGTTVYANIHTSVPGEGFAITVTWPNGVLGNPQGIQGYVDGSGNATPLIGQIPGGCPGGSLILWVVTQNNQSGVRPSFPC